MKFCSLCGASVEYILPENESRERAVCTQCGKVHYQNPNVVTGIVCFYGERVLLCKRAIAPRKGFWTVPAGYMELNETLEDGALRETHEEAGVQPSDLKLLAVYSLPHISQVQVLFLGRVQTSEILAGVESLEAAFFEWSEIPWGELAFPTNQRALHHAWNMKDAPHVIPDMFSGFTPIEFPLL